MKIPKADFELLFSPDVTKATYDIIKGRIIARVDEIFRKICEIQGRNLNWYDFDNIDYDTEREGKFGERRYTSEISVVAEYKSRQNKVHGLPYESSFPTSWLWSDFEEIVERETKEYFALQEKKQEERIAKIKNNKEIRQALIVAIKQKLTPEELSIITFK